MASIYRRTRSYPIPQGAEIVTNRSGQRFAKWRDKKGRHRRKPLNEVGEAIVVTAKTYRIAYTDENGQTRDINSKTPDRDAAQQLADHFETEAMKRRTGQSDPTAERYCRQARRPLAEHVDEYETALTARGLEARYVAENCGRLRRVLELCKTAGIRDLAPAVVQVALQTIRDDGAGLETLNTYLRSVKSFSRWLWLEKRTPDDALAALSKYNAETDRRHVRRELTPDEMVCLLAHVERDTNPCFNLPGPDRAIVYRLALGTGFRAGELRSLTPASFDLDVDPPTVTVAAAYSKRRRQDVQPIRQDLAELLRPWLAERPRDLHVFGRLPKSTARMLRKDLAAARKAWVKAAGPDDAERQRREQSDFLRYRNAAGEVADFHATRHTYISGIVAGGKASVKTCQELARHSTPTLTIGRYSHARLHDLTGALDALPDLTTPPAMTAATAPAMAATGTDGITPPEVPESKSSVNRQCQHGETGGKTAERGERHAACGPTATPDGDGPQVLTLANLGDKKSHVAGRGVERRARDSLGGLFASL